MSGGDPLRVAVVITRLEGGAGVLALRGARALNSQDYEVTLICGSGGRLLDEAATAGLRTVVEPTLARAIRPVHDLLALWRLTALITRGEFDVVHTHCAKAGALGRLAARRAGVLRIVHTFHGFPFHEFQGVLRRHAYVAIERGLGRITDIALCVGNGVAVEAVRRKLLRPDRIRTTRVSVDRAATTATPSTRMRARRALGLSPGAVVVGAVGRLTYQKAPEDFVTALGKLERSEVVGVWVGGGELAARMRDLAADSLPADSVRWIGERADVVDLLPAFDLLVLPSRYEGLPLVLVEAMVCGVPVVATAVNAVGDVVVPGETGLLVPPKCPEALASAMRHLLDSPRTASRMVERARARIDERYGEDALAATLATAYRA